RRLRGHGRQGPARRGHRHPRRVRPVLLGARRAARRQHHGAGAGWWCGGGSPDVGVFDVEAWAPYGVGEPDPATGIYPAYRGVPPRLRPRHRRPDDGPGLRVSWRDILTHWGLVVPDLAEVYGV